MDLYCMESHGGFVIKLKSQIRPFNVSLKYWKCHHILEFPCTRHRPHLQPWVWDANYRFTSKGRQPIYNSEQKAHNKCSKIQCPLHRTMQLVCDDRAELVGVDHVSLCGQLTYLLTYSMVPSPSWEANWFAASHEIPRISQNPKVHYRTHKRPPPIPILGQPNPVHIPTSHLLEIHPNIIHPFTPRSPQWSPSLRFPHQDPIHPPLLTHTRHMPCPSHSLTCLPAFYPNHI